VSAVPDVDRYRQVLTERGLLPADTVCAFVTGSTARGWNHEESDVDLVVILAQPFEDERLTEVVVALEPGKLPVTAFQHDDHRWEVKYWLDSQIDQLFDKVTWDAFDNGRIAGSAMTTPEELFLGRLDTNVPFAGHAWLEQRRAQLSKSAFRSFLIKEALNQADHGVSTAMGQLAAGESAGAVLSMREAFGWSVEALLVSHGEYPQNLKWRPRRFRTAAPASLSYDDYWSIETMQGLDPAAPGPWIERVAEICKNISMDVEV
jgi:hypothetical protein